MTARPLIAALIGGLLSLAAPPSTRAQGLCPYLYVPEGYRALCEVDGPSGRDWRLTVRADTAPLPSFDLLVLQPVAAIVDDPDIWLRERLTLDLSGGAEAFRDALATPQAPFYSPELASSFDRLIGRLRLLDQLPLRACGFPHMLAGGEVWQIECTWRLGPLQQRLVERLVYRGERAYALTIWAAGERRLRHLVAIANSL